MNNKVCKKCNKELPQDYKYKCCEHCRGERVSTLKKVGKGALAVVALVPPLIAIFRTKNKNDNE